MEKTFTINQVKEAVACLNEKSKSTDPDIVDLATLIYAYSRPDKEAKQDVQFKIGADVWTMFHNRPCNCIVKAIYLEGTQTALYSLECSNDEYEIIKRKEIFATKEELIASL